jgi:ribonuclease G
VTQIDTTEVCPVCHGTGRITSSLVIDEQIERRLSYYAADKNIKNLELKVSPILGAYLTRKKGFMGSSFITKWMKKYSCKIKLTEVSSFSVLQNEFYDSAGNKLD